MKTVREWLYHLPIEIRFKITNNIIKKKGIEALSLTASYLTEAINDHFTWIHSPEGDKYWSEIYNNAEEGYYVNSINPLEEFKKELDNIEKRLLK